MTSPSPPLRFPSPLPRVRELAPTRIGRQRKFPTKFNDFVPSLRTLVPRAPLPTPPPGRLEPINGTDIAYDIDDARSSVSPDPLTPGDTSTQEYRTEMDEFGLFRIYPSRPTFEPDNYIMLDDIYGDDTTPSTRTEREFLRGRGLDNKAVALNQYYPLDSASELLMLEYALLGSKNKSHNDVNSLVHDYIRHPDFNAEELREFRLEKSLEKLNKCMDLPEFAIGDIWKHATLTLRLPYEKYKNAHEEDAPSF